MTESAPSFKEDAKAAWQVAIDPPQTSHGFKQSAQEAWTQSREAGVGAFGSGVDALMIKSRKLPRFAWEFYKRRHAAAGNTDGSSASFDERPDYGPARPEPIAGLPDVTINPADLDISPRAFDTTQNGKGIQYDDIYNPAIYWNRLSTDERERFTEADRRLRDVMQGDPNRYAFSDEYTEAYNAYFDVADEIKAQFDDEDTPEGLTSSGPSEVVRDMYIIEAKKAELIRQATRATESNNRAQWEALREAYLQLEDNFVELWADNADLFALPELPVDNRTEYTVEEIENKEKKDLSTTTKVAVGGLALAAAGTAMYFGYKHLPEETKAKIKDTALESGKKAKEVALSGKEKVVHVAERAKETAPSKERLVEMASSVKPSKESFTNVVHKTKELVTREKVEAPAPKHEVLVRGAKKASNTVGTMYKRGKSSGAASKATKLAAKAASKAKSVRR